MDFTGAITGLLMDFSGKAVVSITLNEEPVDIAQLQGKELAIKIVERKKKRSLDANALLWHCLGEMARSMRPPVDKWDMYLMELKKYGTYSYVLLDERAVESFKKMWRETEVVGEVNVNGRKAVQLLCYYGSSTFNTKEFSVLLDGVIEDMKDLGLQPPLTGDIKRALENWEKQHGKEGT